MPMDHPCLELMEMARLLPPRTPRLKQSAVDLSLRMRFLDPLNTHTKRQTEIPFNLKWLVFGFFCFLMFQKGSPYAGQPDLKFIM